MTLDDLLNSSNVNNEIYMSDIARFFGNDLSYEKRVEIKNKLMEIIIKIKGLQTKQ